MPKAVSGTRGEKSPRVSPLYTSKMRELTKREILAKLGPDSDGAMRAYGRKDGLG